MVVIQFLNLLPNSEVIVDNATYHNKQKNKATTTANKKDEINVWLSRQNIHCNNTDIKQTLLVKV